MLKGNDKIRQAGGESGYWNPLLKTLLKGRLNHSSRSWFFWKQESAKKFRSQRYAATSQFMSATLKNMKLPTTYKWLFLLPFSSEHQKKTKTEQSNKNFILKLQSWQGAFPIGSILSVKSDFMESHRDIFYPLYTNKSKMQVRNYIIPITNFFSSD